MPVWLCWSEEIWWIEANFHANMGLGWTIWTVWSDVNERKGLNELICSALVQHYHLMWTGRAIVADMSALKCLNGFIWCAWLNDLLWCELSERFEWCDRLNQCRLMRLAETGFSPKWNGWTILSDVSSLNEFNSFIWCELVELIQRLRLMWTCWTDWTILFDVDSLN
jgi:hypothetical protein